MYALRFSRSPASPENSFYEMRRLLPVSAGSSLRPLEAALCLCRLHSYLLPLERLQEVGCALRVGCRAEYGAAVLLQCFQPMRQICRMVFPDFRRNAKVCRQDGRTEFRHKFLPRITVIAKAFGVKAAVKAAFVAGRMNQFMQNRGIVTFPVLEGFKRRARAGCAAARAAQAEGYLPCCTSTCAEAWGYGLRRSSKTLAP